MPFWKWSKTSDSNGNIDATVNWSEGQLPSTINDSARAMMARLAEYRDDIGNAGTTGGSSNAYTLTTNQVLSSPPPTSTMVAFIAHVGSGFSPTLAVDGGTAYPLWNTNGVVAPPGTLRAGVLYTASFLGTGWLIHHAQSSFSVPIGGLLDYTSTTLPTGGNFIFPYGQAISRASYPDYYGLVGTTFGAGDGSTTFNVPNLKGRITAALDNLGDGASVGVLNTIGGGTTLGAAGGAQVHTIGQANLPAVTLSGGSGAVTASGTTGTESTTHSHFGSGTTGGMNANNPHSHGVSGGVYGGVTVRGADGNNFAVPNNPANITINATDINHGHDYSFTTGGQSANHTHNVTVSGSASSISIPLGGSNTPLNDLPPIMMVTKILRII